MVEPVFWQGWKEHVQVHVHTLMFKLQIISNKGITLLWHGNTCAFELCLIPNFIFCSKSLHQKIKLHVWNIVYFQSLANPCDSETSWLLWPLILESRFCRVTFTRHTSLILMLLASVPDKKLVLRNCAGILTWFAKMFSWIYHPFASLGDRSDLWPDSEESSFGGHLCWLDTGFCWDLLVGLVDRVAGGPGPKTVLCIEFYASNLTLNVLMKVDTSWPLTLDSEVLFWGHLCWLGTAFCWDLLVGLMGRWAWLLGVQGPRLSLA